MVCNRRRQKDTQECLNPEDEQFVQTFEEEYGRIEREEGLEPAKAYFREKFIVRCFDCGYLGKTVPPLNCAHCGLYLD